MQINNSRELAQCSLKPPNDNFLKFIFINENLNAIFVVIFHAIKVQKCISEGSMHKNEENFFWHWKLPEKKIARIMTGWRRLDPGWGGRSEKEVICLWRIFLTSFFLLLRRAKDDTSSSEVDALQKMIYCIEIFCCLINRRHSFLTCASFQLMWFIPFDGEKNVKLIELELQWKVSWKIAPHELSQRCICGSDKNWVVKNVFNLSAKTSAMQHQRKERKKESLSLLSILWYHPTKWSLPPPHEQQTTDIAVRRMKKYLQTSSDGG